MNKQYWKDIKVGDIVYLDYDCHGSMIVTPLEVVKVIPNHKYVDGWSATEGTLLQLKDIKKAVIKDEEPIELHVLNTNLEKNIGLYCHDLHVKKNALLDDTCDIYLSLSTLQTKISSVKGYIEEEIKILKERLDKVTRKHAKVMEAGLLQQVAADLTLL